MNWRILEPFGFDMASSPGGGRPTAGRVGVSARGVVGAAAGMNMKGFRGGFSV
jgi:hypothetical protein